MQVRKCTNTIKRGRPYHKTIAFIFASRLLQTRDDQWPHADDVGYNINKMRHTQVVSQDGLFQCGARGHPITRFSTFNPIDDEFGHSEPVETTEHTGSCPLQTPSKQANIKESLVNQPLTVPTAQIFAKGFPEDGTATADGRHRHVRPQCIHYSTQC